ncbi:AAA-ATPase-like protein [Desulfamplus magnetovallimortis]|uniref:AAA-ATPase-like protein n=1 Tax=Desulfamplus magnetovallimortis TaxID=1246637 RepID=A0A1W1H4T4_9BACT|nr:ATP-binding protein [Desulfamplus magnetovallimortis]SLM27481.1 AAA-ATPase-like protein [Desulfamplus magnetovallimortis]
MTVDLPNLPTGKSSFEKIRTNGDIYVDKTRHIFQMINDGQYYFISRPGRFGKSLFISTLRSLFQGRKELFEGLWISENRVWQWESHPVILIDFNQITLNNSSDFERGIAISLENTGKQYGITLKETFIKERFKELITGLYDKTGMPVVILVDEYDKPIIEHLGRGDEALETAKANRDILRSFFGVIKGGDVADVLRFVFITGVSKFSRVSIFSELNNLTDLTMHKRYAEMFGYTQTELESCFKGHINRFARDYGKTHEHIIEKMQAMYNGYRFSEANVHVYNPFSVLRALDEMAFKKYWFETGTPTFLVNLLREKKWYPPVIENMHATESLFSVYEIERLQPEALLFQTGYVTIKEIRGSLYTFDYPNREVKTAFLENLFFSYTDDVQERVLFALLAEYLETEDLNGFIDTMISIYESIPNTLEGKRDEAYFHTIFYLMVSASGITARSEVLTCKGRIDLLMEFKDKIYIIEFKCNQSADAAIKQIRDKGYAVPYLKTGKDIHLMGINFDSEKRNILDWKHEAFLNNLDG